MKCQYCDTNIPDEAKYCSNCGQYLINTGRDKPTFDVSVLNKIFGAKEKQKQKKSEKEKDYKTSINPPTSSAMKISTEPWWGRLIDKFGWGWAILSSILLQENSNMLIYGSHKIYLQFLNFLTSFFIYFILRQFILTKIRTTWIRSLSSGFIAIILTIPIILLLNKISSSTLSDTNEKTISDQNVTNILKSKLNEQKKYLYTFAQKDKGLWNKFNSSPKSNSQIAKNISLLEDLIPLYKEKDSVLISTFREISYAMQSSDEWKSRGASLIDDFKSVVEIGTMVAPEDQKYLLNLKYYYYALSIKDNKANQYFSEYNKAYSNIQMLTGRLSPILLRVTGKDFSQTYDEIQNKYYNK
jgi:hypothetical protein